jgi:hypothetical protein
MHSLGEAQRAAPTHDTDSEAWLLLEGIALRLQADLRWLEVCGRRWSPRTARGKGKGNE